MQACVNNIYPACPKALTILLSILPVSWLLNDLQHLAMALLRQLGNLRKLIYVKMWKTRLRSKLDTRLLHQPSMWRNHTVSLPITKIVYNDSRLSFDNIPPPKGAVNSMLELRGVCTNSHLLIQLSFLWLVFLWPFNYYINIILTTGYHLK